MRENIVQIYLLRFRIFCRFFCLLPVKPVTFFWVTYGENAKPINDALDGISGRKKIFDLRSKVCEVSRKMVMTRTILPYRSLRFIRLAIYWRRLKHVFIDNYIGEFSVAPIRKKTQRVQLWHAAGALKNFGLTSSRSRSPPNQYLNVFNVSINGTVILLCPEMSVPVYLWHPMIYRSAF